MSATRCPVVFVSHGSPMAAVTEDACAEALRAFGRALPRPRAVVVVSAHGLTRDGTTIVTGAARPPLVYDFGGFPDELYRIPYPCPGDPALANDVATRLAAAGLDTAVDPEGGLDHGVWVPLLRIFPAADVPVIQVGMPYPSRPQRVLGLGQTLAPLRDDGVLLVGSGGAVHNLGRLAWHDVDAPVEPWASAFEAWLVERIETGRIADLAAFDREAPNARLAHPTADHLFPLFFTLGAMAPGEPVRTVFEGFQYGSLSMYSFAAGA